MDRKPWGAASLSAVAVFGGTAYFALSDRKAGSVGPRTGEAEGEPRAAGAALVMLSTLLTDEMEAWRWAPAGRLERNG